MRSVILAVLLWSGCGTDNFEGGGDLGADGGGGPAPGMGGSGQDPQPGQLTAGEYDDNKNFDRFRVSLDELFAPVASGGSLPVADRVTIAVTDAAGQPVSNARVTLRVGTASPIAVPAGTDGRALLFPRMDGMTGERGAWRVEIASAGGTQVFAAPEGDAWTFRLDGVTAARPAALDLAFVVDATGSMSDEINYLKAEIQDIAGRVAEQYPDASLRYALIVYRDVGDEYVVRSFAFGTPEAFAANLAEQEAGGGGDTPEAAEVAMASAMELGWRTGNVARVLFHVADAPPHAGDYEAFLAAARAARAGGIRIFPVAASGVSIEAEYLMRLSALVTQGRYMFLTDDSGIGNPHEEPHIACYQVQYLNDLLVRAIASELAGAYIAAPAEDVLRTVGRYEDGVCGETTQEERALFP